jgi:3-oxoacyl-[acyl-carrier protein] reductase
MIAHSLAGKVALVTGVSRKAGIGAAIARAFAEAGGDVCTTYYRAYDELMPWGNNPSEADDIVKELKAKGVRAEGTEADLSDPETPLDYSILFTARSDSSIFWLTMLSVTSRRMFIRCQLL